MFTPVSTLAMLHLLSMEQRYEYYVYYYIHIHVHFSPRCFLLLNRRLGVGGGGEGGRGIPTQA